MNLNISENLRKSPEAVVEAPREAITAESQEAMLAAEAKSAEASLQSEIDSMEQMLRDMPDMDEEAVALMRSQIDEMKTELRQNQKEVKKIPESLLKLQKPWHTIDLVALGREIALDEDAKNQLSDILSDTVREKLEKGLNIEGIGLLNDVMLEASRAEEGSDEAKKINTLFHGALRQILHKRLALINGGVMPMGKDWTPKEKSLVIIKETERLLDSAKKYDDIDTEGELLADLEGKVQEYLRQPTRGTVVLGPFPIGDRFQELKDDYQKRRAVEDSE